MKIVFWNINCKDKEDGDSYRKKVADLINLFLEKEKPDVLILAECQDLFYALLEENIAGYSYKNPDLDSGIKLNMRILTKSSIVVHSTSQLAINSIKYKNDNIGRVTGNNLKIGVLLKVYRLMDNTKPISIIASHWPFKGVMGHESFHQKISDELKERSESEIRSGKQVILLGDYNKTTSEMLINTSLDISMNKFYVDIDRCSFYDLSQYLYTQHSSHNIGSSSRGYGTYVCKSDRHKEVSCSVLDHIYVSSDFINNGEWKVDEEKTRAIFNEDIEDLMYNQKTDIDHLPIALEIKKWR